MAEKKSQFTTVTEVSENRYFNVFGQNTDEKILRDNLFDQIQEQIYSPFIYPTIELLQAADLEADEDFPVWVRVEETQYKLYKITNLAPGADDIALNNGATATFQVEYRDIGFVIGPASSTTGALAVFSDTSGTQLDDSVVPTDTGLALITAAVTATKGYFSKDTDNTVDVLQAQPYFDEIKQPAASGYAGAIKKSTNASVITGTADDEAVTPSTLQALTATETRDGLIEIATSAEAIAGSDSSRAIVPSTLDDVLVDHSVVVVDTYADIATYPLEPGQIIRTRGHTIAGTGSLSFIGKTGSTTNNGGTLSSTGTLGVYAEAILNECVSPEMFGALGDGLSDDTTQIQSCVTYAVAVSKKVVISRHHRINIAGITVPSNSVIEFVGDALLSLLPHNTDTYQMLRIHDVGDVHLINPSVDGRRDLNSAVGGEFGMGISIRGTTGKVIIDNPRSVNCWGDSYYIGASSQDWCDDVTINNIYGDGSRRQGLSVISAKRLVVNGGKLGNITGTLPAAGVDIEPNGPTNRLDYIRLNNVETYTNVYSGAPGFLLYLGTIGTASGNKIDIELNNCKDNGSTSGFVVRVTKDNLLGRIAFNRCVSQDALFGGFTFVDTSAIGPHIDVIDPIVIDNNRNASSSVNFSAPFNIQREASSAETYAIGNVHIKSPVNILFSGATASFLHAKDLKIGSALLSCSLEDTREISGSGASRRTQISVGSAFTISDRYDQLYRSITVGYTPDPTDFFAMKIIHARTSGNSGFTLASTSFVGSNYLMIENTDNGQFTVTPPAGGNFIGQAVGISARCATSPGHKIIIEKITSLIYRISSIQGSFTYV
jgi:hypothetical protein